MLFFVSVAYYVPLLSASVFLNLLCKIIVMTTKLKLFCAVQSLVFMSLQTFVSCVTLFW